MSEDIKKINEILQKLIKMAIPYFDGKEAPVMEGWIEQLKKSEEDKQ